ncbi:MAG: glycosyltransferase [Eubacterium sp.]|nr:glycosyltransferase [Eubacterium sp.]
MEKYEKDKVSICIPLYNGSRFIKETLESVLDQDYPQMEIIINDDCSSDNSLEIVKCFNDSRIKVYANEKKYGLVGNWNKTVSYASGEFVKLMCQDDLLCAGAVSNQVKLLKKYPSASLSVGNSLVIDSGGNVVKNRKRFRKNRIVHGEKYAKMSLKGRNIYAEPPNILCRTKDFYKIGKYDTGLFYTPDWDFGIRLSYLGDVACSKVYIMKFRLSDISETHRLYAKTFYSSIKDSDRMIEKHQKLGRIKINRWDVFLFKIVVRVMAMARLLFLKKYNRGN